MGPEGQWVVILSALIFLSFFLLVTLFWVGWRFTQRSHSVSPYTGTPLRRTSEISYYSAEKILKYLYDLHQYDNRIFKLSRAAFCRETGRIFQDCINWFDVILVDWNFLQSKHRGNYVSWGSLSKESQDAIREVHASLDGFQTEESSGTPSPRMIEPEFAFTKPGPLYVDPETKILLGWKMVPGTEFEVLIVQKPVKRIS
jgi:hypothetical protein